MLVEYVRGFLHKLYIWSNTEVQGYHKNELGIN
jgi:hypothetical protein